MATGALSAQQPAVPVRYRPSIDELTEADLAELRAAFADLQKLSDDRGYQYYSGLHGLPLPAWCDKFAHGKPTFLHWHRAYLWRFEMALREAGHDVVVPWWDWVANPQIPEAFAAETTPDGEPNPLYSVRINDVALQQGANGQGDDRAVVLSRFPDTFREPGLPRTSLPTQAEVDEAMSYADFPTFSDVVDGIHGAVHMWVGGHMTDVPFAAYDPIFWTHHSAVDRLWRLWQQAHRGASLPRNLADETMLPFPKKAAELIEVTSLGYDYARSDTVIDVPANGPRDHYRSDVIELPPSAAAGSYVRADLNFYGVDHRGNSYTARIFLDDPDVAQPDLSPDRRQGYAGRFVIFGHGGCVGDEGHCDSHEERDPFDTRPPPGLTPQTKIVEITEALKAYGGGRVRVTVIPVVPGEDASAAAVMRFSGLRLLTYS